MKQQWRMGGIQLLYSRKYDASTYNRPYIYIIKGYTPRGYLTHTHGKYTRAKPVPTSGVRVDHGVRVRVGPKVPQVLPVAFPSNGRTRKRDGIAFRDEQVENVRQGTMAVSANL
jgi:hypothetical protein